MHLESAPSLRAYYLLQALKKDEALKQAFWLSQLFPNIKEATHTRIEQIFPEARQI
jgi:hypothetical protein